MVFLKILTRELTIVSVAWTADSADCIMRAAWQNLSERGIGNRMRSRRSVDWHTTGRTGSPLGAHLIGQLQSTMLKTGSLRWRVFDAFGRILEAGRVRV